jgi:hypothetical protein
VGSVESSAYRNFRIQADRIAQGSKERQRGDSDKAKKFDVRRRIERSLAEVEDGVVRPLEAAAEDGRTEYERNDASCGDAHRCGERSAIDFESPDVWFSGSP